MKLDQLDHIDEDAFTLDARQVARIVNSLAVFVEDTDTTLLDRIGCVYAWDPELAMFRRGCEGDTP